LNTSGTWSVDEEFLTGVAEGREPYVVTVTVARNQPYLDIEVISDVHLSRPDPAEFVNRFRRLRRAFNEGRPSHLLVSCGDLTAGQQTGGGVDDVWTSAFERLRGQVPELLRIPGNRDVSSGGGPSARPHAAPVASVTRVCAADDPEPSRALGYVVVIGFDSNEARYGNPHVDDYGQIGGAQLDASRRLVRTLATTIAVNAPIYVIGVVHHNLLPVQDRVLTTPIDRSRLAARASELECLANCAGGEVSALCATNHAVAETWVGCTTNGPGFLAHCRDIRMSMVLHAQMHRREVTTISNISLAPGESPAELSIIACPSFAHAAGTSGMARLRINMWKGEAEVAFSYDMESDAQDRPIQIVRPLLSASRVAPAERRLYDTVRALLDRAQTGSSPAVAGLAEFREHVEKSWAETGYVSLCNADGSLPDLPAARRTTYNLLLLLRERASGGYDILLSRHTPLRASQLGDWDTLLMPAFKDVRYLLEHLRDDVLRQVVDQAEDLELAAHVRAFEEATGRILGNTDTEDIWADQLREVASVTKRKISPTNGCVTDYEYHLVTLLPLIRRPEPDSGTDADRQGEQRRRDYHTIMDWLNELPSVRRRGDRARGSRVVPIEALHPGGSGLRWDPHVGLADEPITTGADAASRVPPGAIWFPLSDDDEPDSPWQQCPSIVARNADVMQWVDQELMRRRRSSDGSFPPEIVIGKLAHRPDEIEFVGAQFPFVAPAGDRPTTPDTPAASTVEAISKVTFITGFDLDGKYAYRDLEVKRVFLARREIAVWSGTRDLILVFDAETHDPGAVGRASTDAAIGVLRPVQRYVLRAGLQRAGELYERVLAGLEDKWGFARIRKGDAPQPVTVTPPILEQLHPDDWEDERGEHEFILCDGNHRVVELVWNRGLVLPAVAVVGTPRQPYYAHPFSRYEWSITAENVQDKSPDQASKYATRKVDLEKLGPVAAAILSQWDEKVRYRRYYRDLSTGFGYMGGQGGRYV
jgi:hypothetical protein